MPFFNRSSGGKENRTVSCILRTQDVLSPKHPMRLLHPTQTTKRENVFFVVFSLSFGEFWRKKERLFASLSNMSVICRVVHPTVFLGYKVMSTLLLSGPRLVFREYATRPPSRCFNILSFPPSPHPPLLV